MTVSTLDRLRAATADRSRHAPVSRTEVVAVEPGCVRARLPSGRRAGSPVGRGRRRGGGRSRLANLGSTVQGGVLATMLAHALDATGGGVELDVTSVGPVATDGERFTARSKLVHGGTRFVAAHADLRDARGRLAAVATASRWRDQVGDPVTKQNSLPSGSPST